LVTDGRSGDMQLALRVCRSALLRRAFHPVVSYSWRRGFYRPRCGSNVFVDQYGCFGLSGAQAAIEKLVHHPETKNPAGFQAGRVLEISMICVRS